MNTKIWLSSPHMSGSEMKYISEAFDNNQVFPLGPNVIGLENDLVTFHNVPYCTCLSSGTAAIHLALIILGINRGDKVICSSFTFCASANPIRYLGADPILIDSEDKTWNMDPLLLEEAIVDQMTKGNKPKAIIAVHLYGMPFEVDKIVQISAKYNIPLIEDAAEALGSEFNGKRCGSFGSIGILSFNGNKIITTSGGGALLSDEQWICEKALFLATQARDKAPHYQHSEIGYNYRMSNICAGIGRGQMEVLEQRIRERREVFYYYKNNLSENDGISFLEEPDSRYFSNHWLTTILIDPTKMDGVTRFDVQEYLGKFNIETRPLWKPMHLQPVYKDSFTYINGTSEKLFNHGLCLPSSSSLTRDTLDYIVEKIRGSLETATK